MGSYKPILGYPGYFVTKDGRIFSARKYNGEIAPYPLREIKQREREGYRFVSLYREARVCVNRYVHRLVLLSFTGNEPPNAEVSHLDGNKANNHLDNLAWESRTENENRKRLHGTAPVGSQNPNSKLKEDQVRTIKLMLGVGDKQRKIANIFKVSEQIISDIKHKKRWAHV